MGWSLNALAALWQVPVPVFANFVNDVRKAYRDNAYNFRHAFDVCQMMYCFLTDAAPRSASPIDTLWSTNRPLVLRLLPVRL